ncbi:hypothetical protein ACLB2K_021814 [Fragaria x ananassa]
MDDMYWGNRDAYSYPKKAGYNPHKIDFVPISGSEDETLIERYTNFDWYKATTLLETHPCDVGLNMNNLAVKDLKHGFVASNSQDDTTKNTTNFTSQIIIMNHPKLYSSKKEHSDGYDGNENDVKKDLESSQSCHFSGGTVVFSDMHDLEASLQSNVFSSKSFLVVKDLDLKESITIFNEQIIRPPDDIEVDDHKCAFYRIFFEFLIAFFECKIESGSSNKACGCQNVHVEKKISTIVDGDVILGYTSEAFTGMVLRFNMESANEGKLQTTQRPATHPGIFDASHVSKKAFFELPDKGISGLVTSKLECKSSLESKDLHSNVATKPVSELDDIFMGHIFMLGCTRPPEDGECWNLDGKTYSRVVRGFLDNRNATVLETLIIEARKLESPTIMVDILGCYGIINACIGTTLSDEAHVTFDEKNAQGIILGSYVHVPILKSCSNEHKIAEATQMLMQISNSELKMDMDLALIREYVSEDKSLHVLLQWHKVKRNSLVDGEKGLIFVDNMVDAFLYALVKGDRHPPLLLPYLIVFVMGEVSTSLELLQHEYHIDLVDLAAVIAIAFTQLHLSHEAADTYKDLNMMTGHKQDVGEYLTWTFMHSKLPHNPNSHNLQGLTQRHSLVHLSELVVHTLSNLETSKCVSTGDTHRAFKYKTLPYCDGIMIQLLKKLSSNQLLLYVKPQTVSCLGDQVLIMVLYYCHKTIGYWPFEDPDYPTTPWYVCTFLGFSVTLCWKVDFRDVIIGRFDNWNVLLRSNLHCCKWFSLLVVCLHGLVVLLAMTFETSGLHQFIGSDDDYALVKALLMNQLSAHVIGSTNYGSKNDAWYSELNSKTRLPIMVHYFMKQGRSCMLAAGDYYSYLATNQLPTLGEQAFLITFDVKVAGICLSFKFQEWYFTYAGSMGWKGYHVVLIMAEWKVCLLLMLIVQYGAIVVVLAMSLEFELEEKFLLDYDSIWSPRISGSVIDCFS